MFKIVLYRYTLTVAVLVIVILQNAFCSNALSSSARGSLDIFHLLLGLYKLNPLKGSKIYSKFAKNLLTPGDLADVFSSNENRGNRKNFQELKEIENILHPLFKKQSKHSLEKPEYDIENVDTENFNADIIMPVAKVDQDRMFGDRSGGRNILEEYGIVPSNENMMFDIPPNTRSLAVNEFSLPSITHHDLSVGPPRKYKPNANRNQYRVPVDLELVPMNDNVLTQDVVVI